MTQSHADSEPVPCLRLQAHMVLEAAVGMTHTKAIVLE